MHWPTVEIWDKIAPGSKSVLNLRNQEADMSHLQTACTVCEVSSVSEALPVPTTTVTFQNFQLDTSCRRREVMCSETLKWAVDSICWMMTKVSQGQSWGCILTVLDGSAYSSSWHFPASQRFLKYIFSLLHLYSKISHNASYTLKSQIIITVFNNVCFQCFQLTNSKSTN